MKCIYCSTDSKASQRTSGACSQCGRTFAFDPKTGDKLTDMAWKAAIDRLSQGETVKFTERNLYYEIARRLQHRNKVRPWILGALGCGAAYAGFAATPALFIGSVVMWTAAIVTLPRRTVALEPGDFQNMLQRWIAVHGAPSGLIVRKEAPPQARRRELPPDLEHYSFDRVVVTDREDTVDLLVANNFHFENNCAVLSVDGYPPQAFEPVRAMLRKNPKLSVYVLHDATLTGCQLARRVRTEPGWFDTCERVVDVGIHPKQARRFKGSWRVRTEGQTVPAGPDQAWLSRYAFELAAIRPEQIIKRLFRSISGTADLASNDGGVSVDLVAFGSDASASDGGGDSFG